MKRFRVRIAPGAERDIERLFDHVLERELNSPSGDPEVAIAAMASLRAGIETLAVSPFTCRKAGKDPFVRELVVPFGRAGYVALFEILGEEVVVTAVRHQREHDFL